MPVFEPDPVKARAAALARVLEPLMSDYLTADPKAPLPEIKYVVARLDRDLLTAAERVAQAVTDLDQARFSRHQEIAARRELDRAARQLRTRLQNREAPHGK